MNVHLDLRIDFMLLWGKYKSHEMVDESIQEYNSEFMPGL